MKTVLTPPFMLVVLDGFGYSPRHEGNAVASAQMPTWHTLLSHYPSTLLHAAGEHVGLLPGYMGNSEAGHLTLGAGRIVPSVLAQFHRVIAEGTFYTHPILLRRFNELKVTGGTLHLMGLFSDAGVHSHEQHAYAILECAVRYKLPRVAIHAFLDGRDTPPQSASTYLERLSHIIAKHPTMHVASIHGRFYAMDRDENWDRTQQTYALLWGLEKQPMRAPSWQEALTTAYNNGITDEFIRPTLIDKLGTIKPGDGIVFFNFRPDRARQLTTVLTQESLHKPAWFISTTRYKDSFTHDILFEREGATNTLLDAIAAHKKDAALFTIAETEKFAHITYFFRGRQENTLPNETRVLIPSLKEKRYTTHPEMSALRITQAIIASLQSNPAFFYLVNYANADMVGHSGDFAATIKACEYLDQRLAQLYHEIVIERGGTLCITADHGNAEEKIDMTTHQPRTAHTTNPVPFILVHHQLKGNFSRALLQSPDFGIASVAPTLLHHMGFAIPHEMQASEVISL